MEGAPTVSEAIQVFLDDLRIEGRSPNTVRAYGYVLRGLEGRYVTELDGMAVRAFLRAYGGCHAPSTVSLAFGAFSAFLNHCVALGWLPLSPMRGMKPPRIPKKPHVYLTPDQLRHLYKVAKVRIKNQPRAKRDELLLILRLLMQGLRANELCSLRWEDVDWSGYVTVRGKGDKWRVVPVDDVVLQMFTARCKFSPRSNIFDFKTAALRQRVSALGKRAGIPIHPHLFRKSWATGALEDGVDIPTVQSVGGWSSPQLLRETYAASVYQKSAAKAMRKGDVLG